ncbi:MAG: phage holin family protein [Phenylobacterium sp.]|uniref:phage holin family protein n=1 Tax=Phenylobacterium sp. TaxID=1871053 RepID=UPI002727F1F0|nr:phage holin family protein [Phenylobacterium sp.]MDO8911041.1 phage holin family protein [Phenylobacterium sp.]MDO9246964.1 phage holin family protein [Phenylobacterium sp.]MDP2010797.1 phage holin family protein [Phenylobacterium sp.]MDP3099696.1 phage holin family protein [Phenylobacterium sp.]MDP3635331.1 phage holin family protein [Phenylobacterium sp.]
MSRFLARVLIAALGLWLAAVVLAGVSYSGWLDLLLAALLLGLVNAIVRPIVFLLTLPLTILTLGLFLLVVNAAMIGLVALLLPGFTISGLIPGILASIIVGVVSWTGGVVLGDGKSD